MGLGYYRPDLFYLFAKGVCGVSALITKPGAYPDIAAEDYHGREICPTPSISSSGLKTMLKKSPFHYWWGSNLNPDKPAESDKAHFRVGKAVHDMLLLNERWPEFYHIVPDGFSEAHHKKWADEMPAYHAAVERGAVILTEKQRDAVEAMADAIQRNEFAAASLTAGIPEMTLAWQDSETGVWLRARPDYLPDRVINGGDIRCVADIKTSADASQGVFSRAIDSYGYHQSAALYADGIKAIYGHYPTHWLHVVIEKDAPHCVALWELPGEDIERGRYLNRFAIRAFADCLSKGKWPGYADNVSQCGLPAWARKQIDEGNNPEGLAWAEAV